MAAPHEIPVPGPAAAFAARLSGHLPAIETERLRLRAPTLEDFPHYAEIAEAPRGHYLTDGGTRDDIWLDFAQMVAGWLLRGHGLWTVTDRSEGTVLGFVLLGFEPGDNEPELGYMVLEAAEGRGIANEAAKAARAYAAETLRLPTLVSTIDPDNHRSSHLAERLGAVRDPDAEAAYDGKIRVYRHPMPGATRRET